MTPYSGSLGWSSLWQQLGESLINAAATATLIGATIVMGWAHGPTCSSPLEEIFPLGLVWEVEICSIFVRMIYPEWNIFSHRNWYLWPRLYWFCLKWVVPTSLKVGKSWEFTGGWSESWKGCFACLMSFCLGKNWQHVSGNVMLPTVCQAVNAPNSAPVRVIEVIYDFIALFKIHLVIPYYFTNWPASKAINKAVDKSVINQ